jgi:hypothetical protein
VTFELARHEFQRTFYVLHDLRVADLVLGLPWLDDEQFGTTRAFTLMMALQWSLNLKSDVPSVS